MIETGNLTMYNCCFCQKNQGQYEQGNGEYACFDCAIGQSRYIDKDGVDHLFDALKYSQTSLAECLSMNQGMLGGPIYPINIPAGYYGIDPIKPNCECGASAVKSNRHSNYCPLKEQKS